MILEVFLKGVQNYFKNIPYKNGIMKLILIIVYCYHCYCS